MSTTLTIYLCFALTLAVILIDLVMVRRRRAAVRKKLLQEPMPS